MKVGDLVRIRKGTYRGNRAPKVLQSPTGIVVAMPRSTSGRGFVKVHWSWNIGMMDERWSALEIINEAR